MNGFCIRSFTGLLLGIALAGQSQPAHSVKVFKRLPSEAQKLKKEAVLADTLRTRRSSVIPFHQRFQTSGTTYQDKYKAQQAEQQRKICEPILADRQKVVNQLARVEKLLSAKNLTQLRQEKEAGSLPIVDTIRISLGRLEKLTIRYTIKAGMGCIFPEVDTSVYPTLMRLKRQKLVAIYESILRYSASTISRLPSLTGNTQTDAANHLQAIRQLLALYYEQLQTSYPQYRAYERGQNLDTAVSLLKFRREFCFGILCDVASK